MRTSEALGVAVPAGLAVGALTAVAQGWLPDGVGSLANSAAPWASIAFVVARRASSVRGAAVAAVGTLWCCEIGYALAVELRGGSNHVTTLVSWLAAGLLAGPPLGVAGAWSRRAGWRRSTGLGVLAGVVLGEAWYGWTTLGATTEWRYWAAELLVGLALVVVASRKPPALSRLATLGAASATTLVVLVAARATGV